MWSLFLKEGMIECLLPTESALFVDSQAFAEEVDRSFRYVFAIGDMLGVYCIDELKLICGHPGSLAMQHFIENEAN